jgi:hypothetical protein
MIFFGNPVNFTSVTSVLIGFFSGRELRSSPLTTFMADLLTCPPSVSLSHPLVVYSAAKNQQAKEARAKAAADIPMYNKDKA